jgi:hypothetical protein
MLTHFDPESDGLALSGMASGPVLVGLDMLRRFQLYRLFRQAGLPPLPSAQIARETARQEQLEERPHETLFVWAVLEGWICPLGSPSTVYDAQRLARRVVAQWPFLGKVYISSMHECLSRLGETRLLPFD